MKRYLALLGMLVAFSATATDLRTGPSITTSGNGVVEVAPDMVTLTMEVDALAPTALAAKQDVDKRVDALYQLLDQMEINPLQVDAATLMTMPQYDYVNQQRELRGYRASRNIVVKLYNLERLSPFVNQVLALKINQVHNMQFGNKDAEGYVRDARHLAVKDSKIIAAELAQAYDANLGPVFHIGYRESQPPAVGYREARMMTQADSGRGYAKQKIRYHEVVDVVFSLHH